MQLLLLMFPYTKNNKNHVIIFLTGLNPAYLTLDFRILYYLFKNIRGAFEEFNNELTCSQKIEM